MHLTLRICLANLVQRAASNGRLLFTGDSATVNQNLLYCPWTEKKGKKKKKANL